MSVLQRQGSSNAYAAQNQYDQRNYAAAPQQVQRQPPVAVATAVPAYPEVRAQILPPDYSSLYHSSVPTNASVS